MNETQPQPSTPHAIGKKRLDVVEFDEFLGRRVRDLRLRYEWSQSELAQKMKVTQNTVSRYELGQYSLTARQLAQLSAIFSITLDSWLIGEERWQTFVPRL